jgi:hypothetical protein
MTQAFRELTKEEYLKAIAKPKRRFQVLALGPSGTVRLGKAIATPCYWFERNDLGEEHGTGRYLRNPSAGPPPRATTRGAGTRTAEAGGLASPRGEVIGQVSTRLDVAAAAGSPR